MLIISYRTKGLKIGHACFLTKEEIAEQAYKTEGCDIVYLYGINEAPPKGLFLRSQHTLIKQLSASEEEIFMTLGKNLRKHIRRGENNSDIDIRFFNSEQIRDNKLIIDNCKRLFEKMYESKNKQVSFNIKMANALIQAGFLVISMALYKQEPIGFCAILLQDSKARRWISAFDFRNNPELAQVYACAHKRLDWESMVWCKNNGAEELDLGGVNSFDDPNGIAQFKLEFEKENKVNYDNYVVGTSVLGKIVLKCFRGLF